MYTRFVVLCFVVSLVSVHSWWTQCIYPYSSELLHWHMGNRLIVPKRVKVPWGVCIKTTNTEPTQSTTMCKPCAYVLGCIVVKYSVLVKRTHYCRSWFLQEPLLTTWPGWQNHLVQFNELRWGCSYSKGIYSTSVLQIYCTFSNGSPLVSKWPNKSCRICRISVVLLSLVLFKLFKYC